MPVRRFRDPEEARRALWTDADDPALGERIRSLWAFAERLTAEGRRHRGISKFESIEAANAEREERLSRRIAELRAR